MSTILDRSLQLPSHFSVPCIDWNAPVEDKTHPYWKKYLRKVDFAIQHLDRAATLEVIHPLGSPQEVDWRLHLSHRTLNELSRLAIYQPRQHSQTRLLINAPHLTQVTVKGRAMPIFPTTMTMLRTLYISLSYRKTPFKATTPS